MGDNGISDYDTDLELSWYKIPRDWKNCHIYYIEQVLFNSK